MSLRTLGNVGPSALSRSATMLAVAGLAASLGLATTASAQCDVYRLNLPDLDQRRNSAPGFLGLPNNGAAHCVPASWADNIAYLSNHGVPGLTLNIQYDWKSPDTYNIGGGLIGYLGFLMGTDGGGTENSLTGLKALFNDRAPGMLVAGGRGFSNGVPPSAQDLAEVLLSGGFSAMTRGIFSIPENTEQFVRTGGHIVAVRHVYNACASMPEIGKRDPNTADSRFANEVFSTQIEHVELRSNLFLIDGILEQRSYWTWVESSEGNVLKIMEGFATLTPTFALTEQPIAGQQPSIHTMRPLLLTDPVRPTHTHTQLPPQVGGAVRAIHIDPSLAYGWVISDPVPPATGSTITRLGLGSGTSELKIELHDILITSCVGTDGSIYAGSGRSIERYDHTPAGGMSIVGAGAVLPAALKAIAADDSHNALVVVMDGPRGPLMCREPFDLAQPTGAVEPCPPGVVFDGPTSLAVDPDSGEVICCSLNIGSIFRLSPGPVGGSQWVLSQTIALPSGTQPKNLQWSDANGIIYTDHGTVVELAQDATGGWINKTDSLYAGQVVGECFALATTRPAAERPSDLDGDRRNIADEGTPPGASRTDCAADFNDDGNLDPDDLGDFITCYFTTPPCTRADYNADADVNPDDLGDFITTYFLGC